MKQIKSFTVRLVAGANIATVIAMLLIGYSDRVNPASHPLIANLGLTFPIFLALNIAFLVFWLAVKKMMALIPVAGLLLGFSPIRVYAPLNIAREAPEGSIKVMSYNIYNLSTWRDPSEPCEILDYIDRERPDILCLEEACAPGWRKDHADRRLDSIYAYSDESDGPVGGDPICIYSRYPIIDKDNIEYESRANNSAAFTLLTGERDTTVVIVNHFETTGLSPEDRSRFRAMMKGDIHRRDAERESRRLWHKLGEASAIRAPQADAVARYVESLGKRSVILVGDFNDSPISYVRHRLASVLNDCYVASGNGPGISYHYNAFYVRIDNIMCSDHWTPYRCHIDNSIKASDHYPIICWLRKG